MGRMLAPPGTTGLEDGLRNIRETMSRHYPRFSEEEYERRYKAVRDEMAKKEISCLIMYASGYGLGNQNISTISAI